MNSLEVINAGREWRKMVIHNIVILERTYVMNGTSGCNKSMTSSVDKLHAAKAETRSNNLLLILLTHYTQYCRTTQYCSVLHLTSYVFSINTHTHTRTQTRARKGMAGNNNKCRPARSCNYYSITRKSLIYALSWPIILNGAGLLRRMFTFCLYFFFMVFFQEVCFCFGDEMGGPSTPQFTIENWEWVCVPFLFSLPPTQ